MVLITSVQKPFIGTEAAHGQHIGLIPRRSRFVERQGHINSTGFSYIGLMMPNIKDYKEYKCIVADEIITQRAPISVFKYIDDSALYYDFPDEE